MRPRFPVLLAGLVVLPLYAQTTKEAGLGNLVDAETLRTNIVLNNSHVQRDLERLVSELAQQTRRPDLRFTVRILCNPSINAYATSGGYIYVHSGLLDFLTDRAQVAAVLAHEIHHAATAAVLNDLSRQGVRRALIAGSLEFGMMTLGAFAGAKLGISAHALPSQSSDLAQLGAQGGQFYGAVLAVNVITHFSSEVELEADRHAVEYLVNAGFDPVVLLEVMAKFKALKTDTKDGLSRYRVGWIDKKPGLDERMRNVRQLLDTRKSSGARP